VSYAVNINNQKHVIHLKKNRYVNLVVHCYYHGEVEGYKDSMVALSTCSGLRGVIFFENKAFGLEPVPQSTTNDHLLYLLEDVQTEPITCGVVTEATSVPSHEPFEPGQSLTSLKRNLPQTSYVELVLVVDNLRYYKQLNIRVVLVGLEIFKDSNPFSVDGSAGNVLGNFVQWRKTFLVPKIRHDIGQLISGAYPGGVLGMAFVGTVCSASSSGGINVFSNNNLAFVSTVVAHEMGHNLGMNHDSANCACNGKSCIMSGGASGATNFSQCSEADFEALILRGGGLCLRNQPAASNVISNPECGNGLLEQGEQCDCGKPQECTNKCCNAATCTFTQGSACAHGACCENCQLKVAGTPCRNSVNTCDLPEYCNGRNESCPNDFYLMDGLPCENNAAYCYEGRCQTYDYQCGHLFAPDICFQDANIQGDRFGNCGSNSNGNYIKCTLANTMCGKVQCTNVNVNNPPPGATVSIKIVAGKTCVNADFNLGTDVLDPAYVNPGSPCATGKTCVNFQCVNASALLPNLICDAKTTCNGRGVCNNLGHCHCENGWGPPYCDRSGWGGSIDSGPAQIGTFKYGETNYWDDENSHDPPEQPPPVQGPGVPRPIQPKQLPS
uniref:Disintegrin and metalloproteinase domain-containing protein 9-like n=1 Tax=Pundamilia nyererei TaxID=303518 RepID=A0A3B4ETE9_9CICH